MPIHGITDKESAPGKAKPFYSLWKGDRKGDRSAGKGLGLKFRFECENLGIRQQFLTFYDERPEEVRIYLPHDSTDSVFETWMWGFNSGGFSHKCDGKNIIERSVKKTKRIGQKEITYRQRIMCNEPCKKPKDDRECPICNPSGLLHFYIRELYGHGVGSMSVTGDRDISGLTQQLRRLEEEFGGLNNSPIPSFMHYGFIPYILRKVKKRGTTPYSKAGEVSFFDDLIITPDPDWLETVRMYAAFSRFKEDPVLLQVLDPSIAAEARLLAGATTAESNWSGPHFNKIESHKRRLGWTDDRLNEEARALYRVQSHRHIREEDLLDFVAHLNRKQPEQKISRDSLIAESDALIEAISELEGKAIADARQGWKEYLKSTYGKGVRQQLNDEELTGFIGTLRVRKLALEYGEDEAIDVEAIDPDLLSEPAEYE